MITLPGRYGKYLVVLNQTLPYAREVPIVFYNVIGITQREHKPVRSLSHAGGLVAGV
jgi:hypothetical protein